MDGAKILIVDDDPNIVLLLQKKLKALNCQIKEASNGKEALENARKYNPDLILLDIIMPDMDGYQACKLLKENEKTRDIPVVFLSANAELEDKVKGLEVGANDYIVKPFRTDELLARLKASLRIKKLQDEIKEKNRALSEANERLKQLKKFKADFIKMITHDLGTPLTVIIGYLQILNTIERNSVYEIFEDALHAVERSVQQIKNLLLELENIAAVEEAILQTDKNKVEIKSMIEHQVNIFKSQSTLHTFMTEISGEIPELYIDRGKIERILMNLISNAVKYSPNGGNIKVSCRTNQDKDEVIVCVEDQGIGIPKASINRVFERFHRAQNVVDAGLEGSGLGLYICKQFIQVHGGRIWVESEQGKGSKFYFELPINC